MDKFIFMLYCVMSFILGEKRVLGFNLSESLVYFTAQQKVCHPISILKLRTYILKVVLILCLLCLVEECTKEPVAVMAKKPLQISSFSKLESDL